MNKTLDEVVKILPALKDKCAVALISRLGAAQEQIRVQQENEGFLNELIGFFTGKTVRRQNQANTHLAATVEMTVEWLTEVTESVALGNQAIIEVRLGLETLQAHTAFLAREVYDLHVKLEVLAGLVDQRFHEIDSRITEVDARARARCQLDLMKASWAAGLFNELPPATRCYVVMEELWWGDFGHYCRTYSGVDKKELLNLLKMEMLAKLSLDMQSSPNERIPRDVWARKAGQIASHKATYMEKGIRFLGDWADAGNYPFVFSVARLEDSNELPLSFPYLFSSERLVREVQSEVFSRGSAA